MAIYVGSSTAICNNNFEWISQFHSIDDSLEFKLRPKDFLIIPGSGWQQRCIC